LALAAALSVGAFVFLTLAEMRRASNEIVAENIKAESPLEGSSQASPSALGPDERNAPSPNDFRLTQPRVQDFNPTRPGQIVRTYLIFAEARDPETAQRRTEQGWPPDLDFRSWNRLAVEAEAEQGDLVALNKRAVIRLAEGREDWLDHEPLIRGSGFYARLRAAEAWRLIYTQRLNGRGGGLAAYRIPENQVVVGLAWDLVAQYLGHMSVLIEMGGSFRGPHARALDSVGFVDILEAEELALGILRYANDERRRRGWPPLRAQWSTR
jgi:hypothetical protein